ncbi:hypothetical protein [Caulobacter phage Cr30]|uniref:hypothetical protein n=1 Tax=Caulobacter phage Cr30 TaxID=1357714 RepID=UPI0004A9B5A6|nr:hypothetical protein OZ74_gp176 [Caulobacter phage Cr30]AGS81167.1 hypothetical protein [Caulobacter phage Cr30]
MGKSWKKSGDSRYYDDYNAYSRNEVEYRKHKQEKRINAALHSKNIDSLIDEDDEEDWD